MFIVKGKSLRSLQNCCLTFWFWYDTDQERSSYIVNDNVTCGPVLQASDLQITNALSSCPSYKIAINYSTPPIYLNIPDGMLPYFSNPSWNSVIVHNLFEVSIDKNWLGCLLSVLSQMLGHSLLTVLMMTSSVWSLLLPEHTKTSDAFCRTHTCYWPWPETTKLHNWCDKSKAPLF